ncbi:MAG: class I mannose-6-phosphate isomerase [Isosphaeraceae bacterium]
MLHKPIGSGDHYAESWEIADHRADVSRVDRGPLAGMTLRELVLERGEELLGPNRGQTPRRQFPLLVKFLDANDVLSVQVHPDDVLGQKLANDNGKTEAWVIVHAEPGSLIYAGLNPGVERKDFSEALSTGKVEPLLHRFEAHAGDCVMIPAGTVHAIGRGIVLAEIQQMSDATFRVHDWGRVGADGQPRTLHLAEAIEATDYHAGPVNPVQTTGETIDGGTRETLVSCPFFALERFRLTGASRVGRPDRFTIVQSLSGEADIVKDGAATPLGFGQTLLLPASIGSCEVIPRSGGAVLLTCVVP